MIGGTLIQTTKYELYSSKIQKETTFAVLADLHDRPHDKVLTLLQSTAPDYILIAGDLAEKKVGLTENVLACLKKCIQLAPTYYALGNHEMFFSSEDLKKVQETGTVLLDNCFVCPIEREDLIIGGLTSTAVLKAREGIIHKAYKTDLNLMWLSEFESQQGFKILLSHHPEDYHAFLKDRKIDLILSGHAHGGQIRIFGHGLYSPNQGIFPKYTAGMIDRKMIVSRGLSNTGGLVPRFFNPRELVVVTICPEV